MQKRNLQVPKAQQTENKIKYKEKNETELNVLYSNKKRQMEETHCKWFLD